MKISTAIAVLLSGFTTTSAYNVGSSPSSRRDVFSNIGKTATLFGIGAVSTTIAPKESQARDLTCSPSANNCANASWKPPAGKSKKDAVNDLIDVFNSYPQEGQNEIDGGGWAVVEGYELKDGATDVWFTYNSSGKGFFAKAFNGGKPFTDDLAMGISEDGSVVVKSQSRIGDSDLGVNKKRLDYLASGLKAKGWSI